MNQQEIGGVTFSAVPMTCRRGTRFWQARVDATGELLPQHYETRPSMWDDLQTACRIRGTLWAGDFSRGGRP